MGERVLSKQTVEGTSVLTAARERAKRVFDEFDHVAVAFSGGKDSTATFQIMYEEAQRRDVELDVVHFDEECVAPETVDYVERVGELPGVNLRLYCLQNGYPNACSNREPVWYPWDTEKRDKWVRDMPDGALTDEDVPGFIKGMKSYDTNGLLFPPDEYPGRVAFCFGIRADESVTRYMAVARRERDNWIVVQGHSEHATNPGNLYRVYPIYDWSTQDVWTAPHKLGWDYNRAYDLMEKAGISHHYQRVAPPYGAEPSINLWMWSICWPDLWEKMVERVEGAASAARYSQTSLYGYGGTPEKPANMTWQQFIATYLDRMAPKLRKQTAGQIRSLIRTHYKKTRDPILRVTHPMTGVSWEWLLMLAVRGDQQHRRTAKTSTKARDSEKQWAAYNEELERYRECQRTGEIY